MAVSVGIGVPLGVLLLVAAGKLWWRHRKNVRNHLGIKLNSNSMGDGGQDANQNSRREVECRNNGYFNDGKHEPRHELEQPPMELTGHDVVYEIGMGKI